MRYRRRSSARFSQERRLDPASALQPRPRLDQDTRSRSQSTGACPTAVSPRSSGAAPIFESEGSQPAAARSRDASGSPAVPHSHPLRSPFALLTPPPLHTLRPPSTPGTQAVVRLLLPFSNPLHAHILPRRPGGPAPSLRMTPPQAGRIAPCRTSPGLALSLPLSSFSHTPTFPPCINPLLRSSRLLLSSSFHTSNPARPTASLGGARANLPPLQQAAGLSLSSLLFSSQKGVPGDRDHSRRCRRRRSHTGRAPPPLLPLPAYTSFPPPFLLLALPPPRPFCVSHVCRLQLASFSS